MFSLLALFYTKVVHRTHWQYSFKKSIPRFLVLCVNGTLLFAVVLSGIVIRPHAFAAHADFLLSMRTYTRALLYLWPSRSLLWWRYLVDPPPPPTNHPACFSTLTCLTHPATSTARKHT